MVQTLWTSSSFTLHWDGSYENSFFLFNGTPFKKIPLDEKTTVTFSQIFEIIPSKFSMQGILYVKYLMHYLFQVYMKFVKLNLKIYYSILKGVDFDL